jgi:hypothetical protein
MDGFGFRACSFAIAVAASALLFAAPAGAATSPDSAGYTAMASSPITTFSGGITVPTPTCPGTGQVEMDMDISLIDSTTFTGVQFDAYLSCFDGQLASGFLDASVGFGSSSQGSLAAVSVSPGDVLKLSMVENATKGTTSVAVTNETTGFSATASGKVLPSLTQISAKTSFSGSSGPGGTISPIPSFKSVKYSNLKFNGAFLSTMSPTKYNMYDGTVLQVSTTAISTTTGTFSTVFKHV